MPLPTDQPAPAQLPLTPRMMDVLDLARREALGFGVEGQRASTYS
jgi:hypothetical protein